MDACFMTYTPLIGVIVFRLDVGFNVTQNNIKTLSKPIKAKILGEGAV